ncbi:MAG: ABC transporter substrate-binding protein [Pseudorhodoplanes sp.]
MRSLVRSFMCVAAVLASLGFPAASRAESVRLGWDASGAYAPWLYGHEKGIFKKHGLDTTLVYFDSGAKGIQGLIGGTVDINAGDAAALMNAKFAGSDIVFVGATLSVLAGSVHTAKDIKSSAELKGKKWGISSFGSEANLAARIALKSFGLAETDVTLVQLGNQANRFAALESGQIQVATFLPPVLAKVEAAGYPKLASMPDLAPEYFSIGPAVNGRYLKEKRAVVKQFLTALGEATAAYKKDREGAVAVLQKYLKVDNPKDAEMAYDYYSRLHPYNLRPAAKAFDIHLAYSANPKAKTATMADFTDFSILDELDKEKYFDRFK